RAAPRVVGAPRSADRDHGAAAVGRDAGPCRPGHRLALPPWVPVACLSHLHTGDPVAGPADLRQLQRVAPRHAMTPRRPRRPSGPGPRGDMIVDDLEQPRVTIRVHLAPADRVSRMVVWLAASPTLLVMGLIGAFLFARALPALRSGGWRFLTEQ